jgi:hypothetical protein
MQTHLRLHQAPPPSSDTDAPATYRFPAAMAEARRTLVAGVVRVPATPEPPARARNAGGSGVLAHIEGGVDRTTDTDRLMRQVESTLDEMQSKLDTLKEDAEQVFKFPAPFEDDRPWAA